MNSHTSRLLVNTHDAEYHRLMENIRDYGTVKTDRTGVGTRSLFGTQMRFDLSKSFPLITTKKVHTRSIFAELFWLISGETSILPLVRQKVTIWDEWANIESWLKDTGKNVPPKSSPEWNARVGEFIPLLHGDEEFAKKYGDLGPVYGKQWRAWDSPKGPPIDQLAGVIDTMKKNPESRRLIVSAWNPADLPDMALAPCHCLFQFDITDDRLSCQLYQRSCDFFLGVPFNIASYAALTCMVAQACELKAGDFIWTGGDTHLYSNHEEQVNEQLSRESFPPPTLWLNPEVKDLFKFTIDDIRVENYNCAAAIKAPIAI